MNADPNGPAPAVPTREEIGWLVELGCSPPQWWMGRGEREFTYDATQAIRFMRFEDAERAICWLVEKGPHYGCKSVEHLFVRAALQPAGVPAHDPAQGVVNENNSRRPRSDGSHPTGELVGDVAVLPERASVAGEGVASGPDAARPPQIRELFADWIEEFKFNSVAMEHLEITMGHVAAEVRRQAKVLRTAQQELQAEKIVSQEHWNHFELAESALAALRAERDDLGARLESREEAWTESLHIVRERHAALRAQLAALPRSNFRSVADNFMYAGEWIKAADLDAVLGRDGA